MARTTQSLTDVDKAGKTPAQILAARKTAWKLVGNPAAVTHRTRVEEDVIEDAERGLPLAGHRGGRRVRLSWNNFGLWTAWQNKHKALPRIDNSYTIAINGAGYEFPGDEESIPPVQPSGRMFTEMQCSEADIAWLEINGVTITQAGGFDPIVDEE